MNKILKKTFALTDSGARGMKKSALIEFVFNLVNMVPVMLLMAYMDNLLFAADWKENHLVAASVITFLLMLLIYLADYNALYNSVYKESADIRIQMAEKLKDLPLSYFSRHDLSDISQTLMADVEAMEHAMGHAVSKSAGLFLFLPVISVMLLLGNIRLGLAVVLPMAATLGLIVFSKKIQIRGNTRYYHVLRENTEAFQENIELNAEIRSYGMKASEEKKLFDRLEASEKIHLKIEIPTALTLLAGGCFLYLSLAIVILVAVKMYLNGEITLLYVVGYILAAAKIKNALDAAGAFLSEIFYLDARIERIREIQDAPRQKGKGVIPKSWEIAFENVSFAYDEETPVLRDVSFTAPQNQVTALVGKSGCGKTSLLRLLSRLYDYDGGKITIGGVDLKDINPGDLYKNMSIVFQDVTLFGTDFMENIRLGKKSASDEEVIKAAKMANCHTFIMATEKGYKTRIGENGSLLSGGERQRISIARAFLKDAPVIVLDEIMASLDVENEMAIQDSLNKLMAQKTVIIISHRMRSIENVDQIVVIDNGAATHVGTHAELIKASEVYRNLTEKANLAEAFVYQ